MNPPEEILDQTHHETLDETPKLTKEETKTKEKDKPKKIRCLVCRKKLGHMIFHCECQGVFCVAHQSAHMHHCPKLFEKQIQRKHALELKNPKVMPTTLVVM